VVAVLDDVELRQELQRARARRTTSSEEERLRRGEVFLLERRVEWMVRRAHADGYVDRVEVAAGQRVGVGALLMVLQAVPHALHLEVEVPDRLFRRLTPGNPCFAELENLAGNPRVPCAFERETPQRHLHRSPVDVRFLGPVHPALERDMSASVTFHELPRGPAAR
jgi:hypothetical protein